MPARTALVFDMDNTLVGSHIDFTALRRSLVTLLQQAGAAQEDPNVLMQWPIAALVARGAEADRARRTALVPAMWAVITAHERQGLRDAAALDDAPRVLRELRGRGFRVAVVTNNARAAALAALESAGLASLVEVLVARDDAPALKPAGDGVLLALRLLAPIDRAYVIGDSWIDGAAAAEAGALFIAYRRTAEDLRAHSVVPWRVIQRLSDLPGCLP